MVAAVRLRIFMATPRQPQRANCDLLRVIYDRPYGKCRICNFKRVTSVEIVSGLKE